MALTQDGRVFSWGHGKAGRLGHGSEDTHAEPSLIQSLAHLKMVQVAAGENHSLAVTDSGVVYSWGSDKSGQLGQCKPAHSGVKSSKASSALNFSLSPQKVDSLKKLFILGIAAGLNVYFKYLFICCFDENN